MKKNSYLAIAHAEPDSFLSSSILSSHNFLSVTIFLTCKKQNMQYSRYMQITDLYSGIITFILFVPYAFPNNS